MLSTLNVSANNRNIKRLHRNVRKSGGSIDLITVQSHTLTNLLINSGMKSVDFISIDVEGSEISVLSSLEVNKFEIDLFVVENNYNLFGIFQFFNDNDYKLLFSQGSDEYYVSANKYDEFSSKLNHLYFDKSRRKWISRFCHKLIYN